MTPPGDKNQNHTSDRDNDQPLSSTREPRGSLKEILNRFQTIIEEIAEIEQHENGHRSQEGVLIRGGVKIEYDYDISIGVGIGFDSKLHTEAKTGATAETEPKTGDISTEIIDNSEVQDSSIRGAPHVEVHPQEDGLTVSADLPGVTAEMVDLQIDSDRGELIIMITDELTDGRAESNKQNSTQQNKDVTTSEIIQRIAIPSGYEIGNTQINNHILTVYLQEIRT